MIPIEHSKRKRKLLKSISMSTQQHISPNDGHLILREHKSGLSYRQIAKIHIIKNHTTIWNFIKIRKGL